MLKLVFSLTSFFWFSSNTLAQEYKCLYYAMIPIKDYKPKQSNDFRIFFTVKGDSITAVKIETIDTAKVAAALAVSILEENVKKIRLRDLQYCFEQPLREQKFMVILAARNYIPVYGKRQIPEQQESWEKLKAHKEDAIFINLGGVYYQDGH